MNRLPAPALHRLWSGPGELVPATVVPENEAVGVRHPAQRRDILGELAKLAIIDMHGSRPIGKNRALEGLYIKCVSKSRPARKEQP